MSRKNVFRIIRISAILLFIVCGVSMADQTYKTVKIGTQTWMAENLNYKTDNSWCYENSDTNCQKYGRLYTRKSAMTACPEGWHLPDNGEWRTLYNYVDANNGDEGVGTSLKSSSGWKAESGVATGTDRFAFSALPAGARYVGGFDAAGNYAYFWSATELDNGLAYYWLLSYDFVDFSYYSYYSYNTKYSGFSVRCLKDSK
jgi:uncharacterized protein (TIGR02145 family)